MTSSITPSNNAVAANSDSSELDQAQAYNSGEAGNETAVVEAVTSKKPKHGEDGVCCGGCS